MSREDCPLRCAGLNYSRARDYGEYAGESVAPQWGRDAARVGVAPPGYRDPHVEKTSSTPAGAFVLGVYAEDGPSECSGLPVRRSTPQELVDLAGEVEVVAQLRHVHRTPGGVDQPFNCQLARRSPVPVLNDRLGYLDNRALRPAVASARVDVMTPWPSIVTGRRQENCNPWSKVDPGVCSPHQ